MEHFLGYFNFFTVYNISPFIKHREVKYINTKVIRNNKVNYVSSCSTTIVVEFVNNILNNTLDSKSSTIFICYIGSSNIRYRKFIIKRKV
ncbi:MAG: hypothetical protein J6S67_10930 [Methanobrevibacter sp.]|nr:hypothetical protein [Methanobrevibacter sp.]